MAINGHTWTELDDKGFPVRAASNALVTLASTNAAQSVKGAPGRLCRISVITALAGSGGVLEIWDNASAGSGTPLYALPVANSTLNVAGTVINVDLQANNGIYVTNASGTITSGAVVIGYS